MSKDQEENEAQNLARLLDGVNKAEFARKFRVPGGASMVSQHVSGHRPISLEAAKAYARGLGVGLEQISQRLAREVSQAVAIVGQNDLGTVTSIPASKFRIAWVVGKGSGGTMPERIWTDGDHPVGATDEYAEIASMDARAFLSEVVGNSMSPRYMPGEFCLVEPGTEPEIEDDVLVRLEDGQTLLKRLLSRRGGYRLGSYNNEQVLFYPTEKVTWIYYVAHPVPRRKIKTRF